jgi:hypothetical protein
LAFQTVQSCWWLETTKIQALRPKGILETGKITSTSSFAR